MTVILGRKGGGGGAGGAPSGPAGGDLAGTYPNPTVTNLIPKTLLDAKGDLIAASADNTAARVAVGTNGRPLLADSSAAAGVAWLPLELGYTEFTAQADATATTEATANTIVTAPAITFDGATAVLLEFYAETYGVSITTIDAFLALYDGAGSIGRIWQGRGLAGGSGTTNIYVAHRLTPSAAAHTYSIRGFVSAAGTLSVYGGVGGSGNRLPGFIRISRVAA